ncbi:MAG: hypothetical protein AB9866_12595 [Syntrophobacteraceae bacterium]
MEKRKSYGESSDLDQSEMFFRIINPAEYPRFGINPQDVPMGTFAAEDHPGYLPSRFGGNAYGLGLIEQEVLTRTDTDFLESINFDSPLEIQRHCHELNTIYQKLGLLIRFSSTGKRYFLIPINLVAHSFQEIKVKADEIEKVIKQQIYRTNSERLDIGIFTSPDDMIVHELTARFSNQRIHTFDTLEKLRTWRIPLDIVILPKDPFHLLIEQRLSHLSGKQVRKKDIDGLAAYLAVRLFDILDKEGKLHILAHSSVSYPDQTCRVRFKSEEELKWFLLFSHIFKTRGKYRSSPPGSEMVVHVSDLVYYLNRFAFSEPQLKRLLDHQRPEELKAGEIDRLPYLNISPGLFRRKDIEKEWQKVFGPLFEIESLAKKSPAGYEEYWKERLDVDRKLPESLVGMVATRRQPSVTLAALEEEIKESGMQGCPLALVAEYRKNFPFVVKVLKVLAQIKNLALDQVPELELNRLANPFRSKSENFQTILQLLEQVPKLEKIQRTLDPLLAEGQEISIVENIEKLSLLGFTADQLREILLIVVGHTTMSRIVFGKISARSLKTITERARGDRQDVFDLLRVCRLMSVAEIIAALGKAFMREQVVELFRLYDEAVSVTTNPEMDWEKLEDLRISSLGGIQNQAIREMMKFFNFFDFLNDWQEYLSKGPLQKEVICDYDPYRLSRMEEVIQLWMVAEEFKQRFLGDYIFGQSYFFRQFLDTEFHGTGPVFRQLGARAGFMLLWIAVNSSEKNIINFNPILAGIPSGDHRRRLNKLRQALLSIPIEQLPPSFFGEIKANFSQHGPAFIFDSGIRLIADQQSRSLEVSFVDIEDNIQKIEDLLTNFESRKLMNISLRELKEMERRFSEMISFRRYLDREGCSLQCSILESLGGLEQKSREIQELEFRLKIILHNQIFLPEEIFDDISMLQKHCPEILGFIIPELRGLGFLGGISPEPGSGSLEDYVMRCLQKYQALVNRDRNSFQDRNIYYRLAKQEFGPLAEEGLGASHPQLEVLEFYINRIREKPALQQALSFALLFQEIGKLEQFSCSQTENYWTHGRRGAEILRKLNILNKYGVDAQIENRVIFLVRHHGLLGHVILGDEPITALDSITSEKDTLLLDAFLVHCVLASAAVKEGVMVGDLLDEFINYRSLALEVIKSRISWQEYLKETLEEKGRAVLNEFQFELEGALFPAGQADYCGIEDSDVRNKSLWQGRQSAALDRLLKLSGSVWVDYEDLQMYLREIPISFIYHKKKLKSLGPAAFEKQLLNGVELLYLISSLSPEVRYYLLYCMDHLGGRMRIYDFQRLSEYFGLKESLKLLIFSLQAFHHHFGIAAMGGLLSFATLARELGRRHEILKKVLEEMPFPVKCFEGREVIFTPDAFGELRFEANAQEEAISVSYRDTVQFDSLRQSLLTVWDNDGLLATYERAIGEIRQKLPLGAENFEEDLRKIFKLQQNKINERILKEVQGKLRRASTIPQFLELRLEIKSIISSHNFSEEQLFLLQEISEFNRSRLRDHYLDAIYREINALKSEEKLRAYWEKIKCELYSYRSFIGKEYEILIARFIDEKLARQ